jgi:hypothetical protein
MAVADDPLLARLGLQIGMLCEKLSNLRFDRLGQQRTRAMAQDLGQAIGKGPWLARLITLLSDTAYHSFIGEVEALNTTTIRRLTPSGRHQLLAIALRGGARLVFLPGRRPVDRRRPDGRVRAGVAAFCVVGRVRERTERALERLEPSMNLSAPLEMQLELALGLTLTLTMGSVENARMALASALEIAESLDDVDAQLRTLWGQWVLYFNIGECRATRSIAEQFSHVAGRTGDPAVAVVADRLMGYTLQHGGEQREAQHYFERVLEFYVVPQDQRYTILLQLDQRVLVRAMLARVLWLRGLRGSGR